MRKKLQRLKGIRHARQRIWLKGLIKPFMIMLLPVLILSSCLWMLGNIGDPMVKIDFINHSQAPITVTFEPTSPDVNFYPSNPPEGVEKNSQPPNTIFLPHYGNRQMLSFGLGYWSESKIHNTSQQFYKLTIRTADKTVIYDKPEQIERLLTTYWEKSGKRSAIDIIID